MGRTKKTDNPEAYLLPFPKRLRELLDRPGETQAKLADAINVNRQSIGQWKDGTTAPDIYSLEKIADYYHTSTDYLLGKRDLQSPDNDLVAIHKLTALSDESIHSLIKYCRNDLSEEVSILLSNQKLFDALVIMRRISNQRNKYISELKSIAKIIDEEDNLTAVDVCQIIENKRKKYKIEYSNSEDHGPYETLYISEYINFLRLELTDTINSIINEITGKSNDDDEYIINTLIEFLDSKNTENNEKVNIIKNFNTFETITNYNAREFRNQSKA